MEHDIDALVVGAGPVGLTTAIALRRLDLQVRIVDEAPDTKREPRADVIFPRAGEALGALGVGETLRRNANEMREVNIYADGRHLGRFQVGRFESAYPRAMTIEQHDIERLLAEGLAGLDVKVDWRTRATDLRVHPDRVEVPLSGPNGELETVTPAWVIACDGARSMIRERLGIPFQGERRKNMQVLQGNVVPTWHLTDQPGHGYFFLAPHRSIIAFPTPHNGYRFFCVRDDPEPGRTETTLPELRDLIATTAHMPDLELALTDPPWMNRARFADRVAAELRHGRVLLVGDAAHSWAPIGGHGMNVGMLGAYNLAWKLAAVHRGQAADTLLDTYSLEQRALAHGVIRDMRANIMEMLLPPLAHRARNVFLRATLPSPTFARRTEWMMSDFGRNHRKSPLSWERSGRPRRGPRAGDRIPDVALVPPAGVEARVPVPAAGPLTVTAGERQASLHQLLRYDRWTLLLNAAAADTATLGALRNACAACPAPVAVVPITPGPDAARTLNRPDELTLVRPDGYVGLVAPAHRVDLLRDYLATFLAAPHR
ncbi:FAD-dependent monooxygenase [Pseudonocardia acidicola]|uniref:2-polyprenyl-6-methoxyphenol hydroxylase n=1 Tax=Pseudonocardia acidicola TaxID=2724939 RepID=A0ABX1SDW9_9PSEU|nr:FAD-dependent monooxygenase [Pseudonocardia acidicola]NMH99775.1 2-polyprenyl-6-methoxyphenol hydroxylase [Pseudonocardia acidicola]